MATAKISQATWDTIGRYVLRKSGGIESLINGVCHTSYGANPNLVDACETYVREGNLEVYYEDWEKQIAKWGIKTTNPTKKYMEVCSRACAYLIREYLVKHKYELIVDRKSATPCLKLSKKRL